MKSNLLEGLRSKSEKAKGRSKKKKKKKEEATNFNQLRGL